MKLLRPSWQVAADMLDPPDTGWARDPVEWARARVKVEPWSGQQAIMESVRDHERTAVHSCVNVGKDFAAALTMCWWIDTRPAGSALVVSSAPSQHQVRAILWSYLRRFHRAGRLAGRTNLTEWWIGGEMVGFGRKPSEYNVEALEGHHALHVLVVLDEASGLPASIWNSAESLTSGDPARSRVLAIGNPNRTDGEFPAVCQPGSGWNVLHFGYADTPNFTGEVVAAEVAAQLISPGWVDARRHRWGEESPLFRARCLGEFPVDSEDGVVPASKLAVCRAERDTPLPDDGTVQLGVDVGASEHGDQTVIRERRGRKAGRVWRLRSGDAMRVVGECVQAIRESAATVVAIDVIGVGFGVAGRLREVLAESEEQVLRACTVVPVNVGEGARQPSRFVRLRSELWWEIGRELTVENGWDLSAIDDDTAADLCAPRYTLDSSGRVKVEGKDDVRVRLGRSTDDADALLLAFYVPHVWGALPDESLLSQRIG